MVMMQNSIENAVQITTPSNRIESAVQATASFNRTVKDITLTSGTYTFNSGYTLPDGMNITFLPGVTINLANGGFIKTTGTGRIYDNGATWNPNSIRIAKNGLTVGRYSDLTTAYNNLNGGETLVVSSGTHTIFQAITIPAGATVQLTYGVTVNIISILVVNGELQMNGAALNGLTIIVNDILRADNSTKINCTGLAISNNGEIYAYNSGIKCSTFFLNGYMLGNGLSLNCSGVSNVNGNGYLQIEGAYSDLTFASGLTVTGNLISNGQDVMASRRVKFWLGGNGLVISGGYAQFEYTDFCPKNYLSVNSITINGGTGSFVACQIISSADYGISVNGGTLAMRYTKISASMYGLNFTNYSSGFLHSNNVFDMSNTNIKGDANSHFNGGIGYNSFRGTQPAYHFYNTSSYKQLARSNYWESASKVSPNNIDILDLSSNYDTNPFICQGYVKDDYKTDIESGVFLKEAVVKNDEPIIEKVPGIEEIDKATILLYSEKYEEALAEMHRLVNKYMDGFVGKRALVFIEVILAKTERDKEILPMLERYSVGESKVAQFAHYRKIYQYFRLQEYDEAIEIMKTMEFSEDDTDMRQARLYDLGVVYHDLLGKKAEAYNYFDELVKTYPNCPLAKVANTVYRITEDVYEKSPEDEDKEIVTPTETKLFANYPNPFNPATVIKYQLSEASQVSLKVYDVMGREVKTLVNSFQNEGSYDVTFNANGLASGIYLYKLNAGGKQFINKMLLMR